MEINIYRDNLVHTTFDTGEQTVFKHQLMGEHKIEAHFISYSVLDIQLGDYIKHNGENFYINQVPAVIKHSNAAYEYAINFEGEVYRLYNKLFMHEGAAEFDYFGDAEALLTLIVSNINTTDTGWTAGTVATVDPFLFHFENDTCRTALTKIADQFKLEFSLSVREISLVKSVGHNTTLLFEYGKGKGLYEITRNAIDDKNVVTRVYGFGGDKNLGDDYRDGAKKLIFDSKYLESNTALYGIIEGVANFPDVYPQRTGTVTSTTDINKIIDTGIDFNINDYLLTGQTATIVFKTGDLAGSEFEISNYNSVTKEIRFNPLTEANDYQLPNDAFKPAVGDKYTLVNIKMPGTYITAAETELQNQTQGWLDENDHPRVSYALNIDRFHAAAEGIELHIGDKVQIKDAALNIDNTIRAIGISYPLTDPFRITATIADFVAYTAEEKNIAQNIDTKREVVRVDRTRTEASRRNAMRFRQLQDLIFDPDGYFDSEKIKPESIETLMLSVGAKSQNFSLSGVRIQPNYQGDPNSLHISDGQLIHFEIKIEGLGYTWDMVQNTFDTLESAKHYYLFAKCSKSQLSGAWEMSETPVHTEDITGFYAFNLGILYAVSDGRRDFAFTNGMTFISGDNVTTGRIQDLSGQNYFDLTQGKFNLGDNHSGVDWDVTKPGKLTIRGGIVANTGGVEEPLGVFRGEYDSSAVYYTGDTLTFDGSYWKVISLTPITGSQPSESNTNYKLLAKKGETGAGVVVRVIYAKNTDADNPPAIDVNVVDPAGWSLQMPPIDTQWLLGTEAGDYIVGLDGEQYLTTVDGEYIWASTEVLNASNEFDHWSAPTRITGRNGIPNEYTELRFQKNGSPVNPPTVEKLNPFPPLWNIQMPAINAGTEYIWMIKANKLPDTTLVSAWSEPVRVNGVDGGTVAQGDPGPFMMYRGAWDAEKQYVGNSQRIEAVSYSNAHYVTRIDAGVIPIGTLPTDTDYWNEFVGEFESVSTNLLLSEMAYIKNLGVNWLRTNDSGQRIEIKGKSDPPTNDDNSLVFYDENGNEVLRIDDSIDTMSAGDAVAGMRVNDSGNTRVVYMTGNGIFSNAGKTLFLAPSTGITTNASVVGMLFDRNDSAFGLSAAVAGIDVTNSGNSQSYGGYFNTAMITQLFCGGLNLSVNRITGNYTIGATDTFIASYATAAGVVIKLPIGPNLKPGRLVFIKRVNSADLTIDGNGNGIMNRGEIRSSFAIRYQYLELLIWDGQYWHIVGLY